MNIIKKIRELLLLENIFLNCKSLKFLIKNIKPKDKKNTIDDLIIIFKLISIIKPYIAIK